jgi:hypothetical protein
MHRAERAQNVKAMDTTNSQTPESESEARTPVWGHVKTPTAALIRASAKRRKRSVSFVVAEVLDEWAAEKLGGREKAS